MKSTHLQTRLWLKNAGYPKKMVCYRDKWLQMLGHLWENPAKRSRPNKVCFLTFAERCSKPNRLLKHPSDITSATAFDHWPLLSSRCSKASSMAFCLHLAGPLNRKKTRWRVNPQQKKRLESDRFSGVRWWEKVWSWDKLRCFTKWLYDPFNGTNFPTIRAVKPRETMFSERWNLSDLAMSKRPRCIWTQQPSI